MTNRNSNQKNKQSGRENVNLNSGRDLKNDGNIVGGNQNINSGNVILGVVAILAIAAVLIVFMIVYGNGVIPISEVVVTLTLEPMVPTIEPASNLLLTATEELIESTVAQENLHPTATATSIAIATSASTPLATDTLTLSPTDIQQIVPTTAPTMSPTTPTSTNIPTQEGVTLSVPNTRPHEDAQQTNVEPVFGEKKTFLILNQVDVSMVFVPSGEFHMGSNEGYENERPEHLVFVDSFWIDQTEVTNAQFAAFVDDTGYITLAESEGNGLIASGGEIFSLEGANWRNPHGPNSNIINLDTHPVTQVSWHDASEFCTWRGARLPSESEWEKAARGTNQRIYPWGNVFEGGRLNFCDRNCPLNWKENGSHDGYQLTAPVGSYTPTGDSPYGIQDMIGNVWEWTLSQYLTYPYVDNGKRNSINPANDDEIVVRGGAWFNNSHDGQLRALYRTGLNPTIRGSGIGFRCAHGVDATDGN